jgi:RimJ/RimL family protein N-acetyltransferase
MTMDRAAGNPTVTSTPTVVLRPITVNAARAILLGQIPTGLSFASDYPTEFSIGIAQNAGQLSPLGPYFILRSEDDMIVGEIGGGFVDTGSVEIGYAIVGSCRGHGYATDAVRELIRRAWQLAAIRRIVGHTPLDRPDSGRVLQKAAFTLIGQTTDEHDGNTLQVHRWELSRE